MELILTQASQDRVIRAAGRLNSVLAQLAEWKRRVEYWDAVGSAYEPEVALDLLCELADYFTATELAALGDIFKQVYNRRQGA